MPFRFAHPASSPHCLLAVLLLAVCADRSLAQPTGQPSPAPSVPPSTREIESWLEALDDERFLTREKATEQLRKAGLAALALMPERLPAQSLEAASRSLAIVQAWGLSRDQQLQDAAFLLLKKLAAGDGPIPQRAAQMLVKLQDTRRVIVLRELEGLGAKIHRRVVFDGVTTEEVIDSVEIGPDWKGLPADLQRLGWLSGVNQLALVGPNVGDEALAAASAAQGVRSLQIYRAKVTDAALSKALEQLRPTSIGVYYVDVGDAIAPTLEKLAGVTTLRLYGTKVERAAADKLQAQMTGKVDFRLGGFLGVGCTTVDGQCVISRVQEKSPADMHGIKADDVVLRVGDKPVAGFEDLTAAVSLVRSGDSTELLLERTELDELGQFRRKKLTLKVPLAEWDVSQFVGNPLND